MHVPHDRPREIDLVHEASFAAHLSNLTKMTRSAWVLHIKKRVASHHSGRDQDFPRCLLLSDGAVPVDPAAFMEAVTHHALAKQKKDDCQDDHKQELSNSERGWRSSCRSPCIQRSCHQICLSARL